MRHGGPQDLDVIKARLRDQITSVLAALYGVSARQMRGARLMLGDLSGNDGDRVSIVLKYGVKPGLSPGDFKDFSGNASGDILDLIAAAKHCDFPEAVRWARGFLHIDYCADPEKLRAERAKIEQREQKARAEALIAEQKRVAAAQHIFLSAHADIRGTPVESYLRGQRHIDLDLVGSTGACRYQPDCLDVMTGKRLPAMVLCVTGPNGKISAVHRTYLEQVDDQWRAIKRANKKGKIKTYRLSLGNVIGGHVSVSRGRSDVPLGRAPQGDSVLIAEGYETALTYAMASPELRVISCLSLGNMASVAVPATVTKRILVHENGLKPQGEDAFQKAVKAHKAQCDDVRILETEAGYSDDNDWYSDDAA